MDHDGYTDVVVSDTANNLVSVLLNDRSGGFHAAVTYSISSPGRVVVGDFLTGYPDIAVITATGVSILPNNGNGTFGTAVTLTAGSPTDMVAADLNGDGYLDLAVSSQTGNKFTVFLNNGNGTMAPGVATVLSGSRSPFGITSGDYNGDGVADLATVDPQGYLITLINDGTGTHFQQNLVAAVGTGTNSGPTDYSKYLATLDLNGDGWADVVVGESLTDVLYTATGDSYFTSGANTYFLVAGPVTTPNTNGVVTAGDVNNDGLSDFVLAGGQPSLWLSYATTLVTYPVGSFAQTTYNVTSATSFAPHTLQVNYVPAAGSGFSAASSGTFTANVMGSSTPVVTTSASSINYGGNVTVTITLPPVAGVTPTGNIILDDGILFATPLTLSGGTATYTYTQLGGGVHHFFAEYVGDATFVPRTSATVNVTVVPETPTSISITASPTSQIVNGPMTLSGTIVAPVSGSSGQTLNFDIAGFPGGSCVTNNAGTCSVTTTMPGTGAQNANVNNSTTRNTASISHSTPVSGFQQTMVPVITSSVNPTFTGQTTTFTITLPITGGVLPNGTVTLTRNGATIATLSAYQTGVVTYTTNGTPIGSNSMVASYSLDQSGSYLSGSSAPYTQTVGNASTVLTLGVSPANATQGTVQTLTLSAISGGSLAVSNGIVQFFDTTARPQLLGTTQINTTNTTATLTAAFSPGPHSFYAVLTMPSPGLTAHTSSTVTSTVTPARTYPFSLSLSRAGQPGAYSLTATAAHTSSFPPTPLAFLDHTNGNNPIATSTWATPIRSIASTGPTPNAAGQGGFSTAVGDVNGDGIPDMVIANYGDQTYGVLLGNGDGTFQPQVTHPSTQPYNQVLLLDMNGDGILDLVGLTDGNNAVDVSLGVGNGTFDAHGSSGFFEQNTSGYSTQMAFGDINKDGYLDIVSADSLYGISLMAGDGTGNMPNHVAFVDPNFTQIRPLTLAVGDFNNDGNLDVVTANVFNVANASGCPSAPAPCVGSVTLWMGDGNGNFTLPSTPYYDAGPSPYGIAVGDFNGDGKLDVAVANQNDHTIGILLGNGDGTLQAMVTYPAGTVGPQMVKAVDVDGDGILDLVAVDTNTQITTGNGTNGGDQYNSTSANAFLILKGNGDGTFQTATSTPTPSNSTPYDLSFGDFDGDGLMDIALPYNFGFNNASGATWPNSKAGVFMGLATSTSILTGTALNAAGPVSVEAQYQPPTHDAYASTTSNLVQLQSLSSISLSSGASSSPYGTPLVFTASVPTIGGTPPTGTVQFVEGSTVLGSGTLSTGTATYTNSTLARGPHTITAVYAGDANYATSTSSSISQVISNPTTTVTLSSSANPAQYNAAVTLTATLGSSNATGSITFMDGSFVLSISTVSSGSASFQTSSLTTGTHSITAVYGGDPSFVAHTSAVLSQVVSPSTAETIAIVSTGTPVVYGTAVTFTATLGIAGATGTVQFKDGTTIVGTASVSGRYATLTTAVLTAGAHSITAVYTGDATYAATTSPPISQGVTQASSATSVAASAASSSIGASVTFTAAVAGTGATGTVTFKDGASTIGTGTLSSGTATFATASLAVGTHSITAVYGGDTNYTGSASSAITEIVSTSLITTLALSGSPNPSAYGASVTFTATLGAAAATGSVIFKDGGSTIGTGSVSSGVATFGTSSLTRGSHTITAVYGGDSAYASVTSTVLTQTVNLSSAATATVATSGTPAIYGTSVTFTATLAASAATGTVTFKDGGATIGSGNVASGTANFSTAALSGGTHTITAVYSGDTNYATSTSSNLTQVVTPATPILAAPTLSPTSTAFGATVTISQTVPNGLTGSITFYANGVALGSAAISGTTAVFTTTGLPGGTNSITGGFAGNTNYTAATSAAASITIAAATPSIAAPTASPSPSSFGANVSLTQNMPAGATGSVTFYAGATSLGTSSIAGGVATLATTALPTGTLTLTTHYAGNANYAAGISAAGSTVVNATPTSTTLSASPISGSYGTSVTLSATVLATGAPVVGGTVAFQVAGVTLGSGTTNGSGVATFTTTTLNAGTNSVTAVSTATVNYVASTSSAATITISPATPSLGAPTLSPSSSTYGAPVTITQTVPPGATGTITFYSNGVSLGTATISGGVATLITTALPTGTNSLTTQYGGNANYTAGTSAVGSIVIAAAPTVTVLSGSPTSGPFGTAVVLTATVTANGAPATTGAVNFQVGGASIGTAALNGSGVASITTTSLNVAANVAGAIFGANGNYAGSGSSPLTITITQAAPSLSAPTISPASGPYGTSVTLTQTFPAGASGTASFYSGGVLLGTANISGGVATLVTNALPAGSNSVTTQWPGSGNYTAATSAPAAVTISQVTPVLGAPSASPASPSFGSPVTLSQTVPPGATGTVTFTSGGVTLGTGTIVNGVATIVTSALLSGSNAVQGTYNGNANYTSATATGSVTVSQATPTLAAPTASPAGGSYGTQVTLTQTVPSGLTGVITFMSGSTVLGTAPIVNGAATLAAPLLPAGSNAITGLYSGNSNYGSATSSPGTVTISQITPTLAAPSVSPASITYGGSVTLTQSVPAGATGTVTFASGATVLGTATILNGVATLVTTAIPGGSSPVTGFYGGNNNYTSALSAPSTVTVAPVVPVLAAPGASPAGGPYGTPITLTQVIPSGATGTVTFTANGVALGTGTIVNGVATLTTTAIPTGTNITVGAYPGNGNYTAGTSAPTTVTIAQATPVLPATTISPASAPFGSPVTVTQAVPPGATGTVTFTANGVMLGAGAIVNGVASITTSSLPLGGQTISATYGGNANYAATTAVSGNVTITQATPALPTPSASPTNPTYGTPVMLTQAVPSGLTGTVTFMSGSMVLGTATISGGVATLTTSALPTGSNAITGVYGGGTNYTSATSPANTLTVAPASTTLAAPSASPSSTHYGGSVTLTQTVPYAATGTVTFTSGSTVLGTATIANGVATLVTTAIPGGSSPIVGMYNGNTNFAPVASSPSTVVVAPSAPILAAPVASPTGGAYGTAITLTQGMPPGATGTVTFTANGVVLGTGTIVNGVASLTTTSIPAGTNITVGAYPGNGNYTTGTSAPTTITISQATPVLAAPVASPSTSAFGSSVTLTQSVPPGATGTVIFSSGSIVLGTATISGGIATLTTTALPVGTNPIIGAYSGNGNFAAATSAAGSVAVTPATASLAAPSVSPTSASYGAPVTISQTVPSGLTGTITFLSGSTVLGTATIINGVATLTTTALPGGANTVTGVSSASGNYGPSTSAPATITIAPVAPVLAAPSASTTSAPYGTSITLTQTVPPGATGTVTVSAGSTILGTAAIANGVASLTTTTIPPGANAVTGTYSGNGNYTAATSAPTTITIAAGATVVALTASPTSATVNSPVTLTANVSSNGVAIGSTTAGFQVQFFDGNVSLGTAPLSPSGAAILTSSALTIGSHALTASFAGYGIYPAGVSTAVNVTVGQIAATLPSPVPSPTSGVYGTSITLMQTMPAGATGTVTFMAGTVVLGTATIVNGVATLTTSTIPAGTNAITAVYSGNATYAPTTSASGAVTIQQATPPVPTLTASPTTAVFGTPVALTATFPGSLTGSVTFFSGTTSVGTTLIANGVATITASALPVGTDAVTATFTGNNNYAAVSSSAVAVTITPPTYTITANPPSLTIHAGQTGTTVLTFTPVGGYSGTFTMTCAGLPANAACQFLQNGVSNPTVVMDGSNQPIQATLNLMTSVPTATAAIRPPSAPSPDRSPGYAFIFPAGLLALAGSIRHRRSLRRFGSLLVLTLAAGAILGGLAGCGGGGFGVTATPVGKSVVQVTATASAVSTPGTGNGGSAPTPALSLSITIIQ